MNMELVLAFAKRVGHETLINVQEHDNLLEEVWGLRLDVGPKRQDW